MAKEEMVGLFELAGSTPAEWSLAAYKVALRQLAGVMKGSNMSQAANDAWDKLDAALDDIEDPQDGDEVDDQLSRLYALHRMAWSATAASAARGCPGSNE